MWVCNCASREGKGGSIAVGKERDKEIVLWTRGKKKGSKVLTTVPTEIYE